MMKTLVVCFLLIKCVSVTEGKGKECEDRNGNPKCCFHHEEVDNSCIQCKVGYTSRGGALCSPCKDKTYGHRCLRTCACSDDERCDHVQGCIRHQEPKENLTLSTDEKVEVQTSATASENGTTSTSSTDDVFLHSTSVSFLNDKSNDFLSPKDLIVYTLCVTTVVFLICVSNCIRKCRKRKHKIEAKENQARSSTLHDNIPVFNEYLTVYEEIDENAAEGVLPRPRLEGGISSCSGLVDDGLPGSMVAGCDLPSSRMAGGILPNSMNKTSSMTDVPNNGYIDASYSPGSGRSSNRNSSYRDEYDEAVSGQNQPVLNDRHCDLICKTFPYESLKRSSFGNVHEYEVPVKCSIEADWTDDGESASVSTSSHTNYVDVLMRSDSEGDPENTATQNPLVHSVRETNMVF